MARKRGGHFKRNWKKYAAGAGIAAGAVAVSLAVRARQKRVPTTGKKDFHLPNGARKNDKVAYLTKKVISNNRLSQRAIRAFDKNRHNLHRLSPEIQARLIKRPHKLRAARGQGTAKAAVKQWRARNTISYNASIDRAVKFRGKLRSRKGYVNYGGH